MSIARSSRLLRDSRASRKRRGAFLAPVHPFSIADPRQRTDYLHRARPPIAEPCGPMARDRDALDQPLPHTPCQRPSHPREAEARGRAGRNPTQPFRVAAGCPASPAASRPRLHRHRSTDVSSCDDRDARALEGPTWRRGAEVQRRSTNHLQASLSPVPAVPARRAATDAKPAEAPFARFVRNDLGKPDAFRRSRPMSLKDRSSTPTALPTRPEPEDPSRNEPLPL